MDLRHRQEAGRLISTFPGLRPCSGLTVKKHLRLGHTSNRHMLLWLVSRLLGKVPNTTMIESVHDARLLRPHSRTTERHSC
jgi:hypothetical protein